MHIVYSVRNLISEHISSIIIRNVSFIVSWYSLYIRMLSFMQACIWSYFTLHAISVQSFLGMLHQSLSLLPHDWLIHWEISLLVDKPHLLTLCLQTLQTEDKVVQKNYINCCPAVKQISLGDQKNISVKSHKLVVLQ